MGTRITRKIIIHNSLINIRYSEKRKIIKQNNEYRTLINDLRSENVRMRITRKNTENCGKGCLFVFVSI